MAALDKPDWLTDDFLKSCLESDGEQITQNVIEISHSIEHAVSPGNNYGSMMFRVNIIYKKLGSDSEHSLSLIVKAPIEQSQCSEEGKKLSNEGCMIEQRYYSEFITNTFDLMKHNIVPKHYKSPHPGCIVLEDLKSLGYEMVDRHKMLDFDHCQLYIKAAAKLHALSMVLYETRPEIFETVLNRSQDLLELYEKITRFTVLGSFRCMATFLEGKSGCEKYLNILKEAIDNELFLDIFEENNHLNHPLVALTQNDPWCANMMFKYDNNGNVIDIKIFDFQLVELSPPLKEFMTFVWISADQNVRETQLNDLYKLYCKSLKANLAELGYQKNIVLRDLESEIVTWSPLILYRICMNVPVSLADEKVQLKDYFNGNILEMESVKESPVYKTVFEGTTFNKLYLKFFQQIDKLGVFENIKKMLEQAKSKRNHV
ncbi:hypothetical protein J6590_021634 [Homalodisca vitripennis]|nr:hypothetical protein J6590_021634 [Homalodisca vitripennis]